jgi:hypothetical protein
MNNPCEKCIVNPMCQKECPLLVSYLHKQLTDPHDRVSCAIIAWHLKKGNVVLFNNDKDWRQIKDE